MTDCEWVRRVVSREETGAVPYNFMFSPPAERLVAERFGPDIAEALALPIRMIAPRSPKPFYADPAEYGPTARDEFGVTWTTSVTDRGSPVGPCLPGPDLAGYRFPDPARPGRFDGIGEWCAAQAGHYRVVWAGALWERASFMRGQEEILADIMLHPGFVADLLAEITAYILETIRLLSRAGDFECFAFSDDYGTQRGLIMSPVHWRKFIRPRLAEVYACAAGHGRAVFHHSCGHIQPVIGDMIDLGLDILHPVQPEAMDIGALKRMFGRRLAFCGGFPTQRLLASGTPEDVRREVRRLKRELGAGGGYILEPGITVQPDVPPANLFALIDEARARD